MPDRTESSTTVAAAPTEVLAVIREFEAYPDWTGSVKEAEVLSTVDGDPDEVRFVLDAGSIKDTYTLRYDWDVAADGTGTVSWHLVKAGLLKALDGSYELRWGGTNTALTYRLAVDLRMPMLGMLKRKAEKKIIDTALQELKKRVEG